MQETKKSNLVMEHVKGETSRKVKQLETEVSFLKNVIFLFDNYINHLEKIIEGQIQENLKFKNQDN